MVVRLLHTENCVGSIPTISTSTAFGEMDIIFVFETKGGSSILSGPAKFMEVWQSLVYCTGLENRRL